MQNSIQSFLTLRAEDALTKLKSNEQGLTHKEAANRQIEYGANEIVQKTYRSHILISLSHSTNPLVAILLIAALISALTGSIANALIIITIVIMSFTLDYVQSHRSLVAVKRLQEQVATTTDVLRDGEWIEIPCRELVPGDVIRLVAGNMVPADSLLLHAKDLHVQQAALTGESLPVEKESIKITTSPKNPAEAINAVFAGSSIVSGTATALVVMTGQNTLFGEIASNLRTLSPPTEFDKGITRFGFFIMKTVFVLVLFVFFVNIFLHRSPLESLLFAVALAVGLTPELLPMITTVTLATGAVRMAKKKVIVKNLSAIQNFGSIDILCSDKTGTLTSGQMILEKYVDLFGKKSEHVMLFAYLNSLFGTGIKNPLDVAVLKKADINPLDAAILRHDHPSVQSYNKIDEIPFDFERRCASVVIDKGGTHLLIVKGAPEHVMKACTHYDKDNNSYEFNNEIRKQSETYFQSLCSQGYRVLAIAYRKMPSQSTYSARDERELVLAGFIAFIDPPLKDAASTIKELQKEGVTIKILTGDNNLVAQHICQEVGLDASQILIGDELEHMTDLALAKQAEQVQVFARISPVQKLRIICALRSRGHVVGYIGDGINDAPSLHNADVGISVSSAVDVAREAADIILLETNLKVLLNGIMEGRKSFGNVMKYLIVGTSSNFGNMLSMVFALAFIPFLPATPTQLLLNGLLYDISQVTIPTDNVDRSFTHKPRHWNIDIVKKFMLYLGPLTSFFDLLTFFVMLKIFQASEALFQTGWFVESLATQVLIIFVVRTVKKCWQSKPSLPLTISVLGIVAISILIPFSPIAKLFGLVPLPLMYFLFLIAATFSFLTLMEIFKKKLLWHWLQNNSKGLK
ncbi:MAG: magnesium-translocating P-type ATPase [Gammaproteobacteria bacterium]